MLIEFRAENVRSFRDGIDLSFLATTLAEPGVPREISWREGGKPINLLPAAGIFGANASGKSNLLRVMDDMRGYVLNSFKHGRSDDGISRRNFLLDGRSKSRPSRYEVEVVLHGIRHSYGFVIDDREVLEEWALRYPRGKAATIFHRHKDRPGVSLGSRNRAKGNAVQEILRPNSLFLSAAAAANHPDLVPLYEWFENNLLIVEASSRSHRWMYSANLLSREESRDIILALLQAADLGITNARLRKIDPHLLERYKRAAQILADGDPDGFDVEIDFAELGLVMSHRGSEGDIEFDVQSESLGTLVWFGIVGPMVSAIATGSVLLVDEIEASLHPSLVNQIVRTFQDRESNPRGAQLVFSSHEATLLGDSAGNRIIGRDQVWFTEKGNDGRSRLYPLTDLNPRKEEAVGKRYLAGRYGATPIISREKFAEVASHIMDSGGDA